MRGSVIIERRHRGQYSITVADKIGGGYTRYFTGDAHQVAAEAAVEIIRYAQSNPDGADLIAPSDVCAIVPAHLAFNAEAFGLKAQRGIAQPGR